MLPKIISTSYRYELHPVTENGKPDLNQTYNPEGYSKYWERWTARDQAWQKAYEAGQDTSKMEFNPVYGINQVIAHRAEMQAKHPDWNFCIIRVTEIVETVDLPLIEALEL